MVDFLYSLVFLFLSLIRGQFCVETILGKCQSARRDHTTMRLFFYECYKVLTQKAILILLIFLFLFNGFSYWNTQRLVYAQEIDTLPVYEKVLHQFKGMDVDQAIIQLEKYKQQLEMRGKYRYAQMAGDTLWMQDLKDDNPELFSDSWTPIYSDQEDADTMAVTRVLDQLCHIRDYESKITKIQTQSKTMLATDVFQDSTGYSRNNIIKTARDFSSLYELPLFLDMDYGVEQVGKGGLSDVLLLAIVVVLALGLIAKEKQSGVLQLVQPTLMGRGHTLRAKLAVLLAGCALSTVLIFTTNLLISGIQFGFGNLGRYVQSISSFLSMELVLTVGEFFLLTFLIKLVFACLIGLLCFAILCFCKSTQISYIILAALFGGSYLLYTYIPSNAYLNHLKYINLFTFLNSAGLLKNYQNLNLFSQAVNLRVLAVFGGGLLLLLGLLLSATSYRSGRFFQAAATSSAWMERLALRKTHSPKSYAMSLFSQECYKLFIKYKAGIPLILVALIQLSSMGSYNPVAIDSEEAMFYQMVSLHSGPISQEPSRYIAQCKEERQKSSREIEEAEQKLLEGTLSQQEYDQLLRKSNQLEGNKPAFARYEQRYQQLMDSMDLTGIEPGMIDDRAYGILFTSKTDYISERYFSYANALILLLAVLILGCGGMFCYEHKKGSKQLLLSSKRGRGPMLRSKILVCTAYSLVAGMVVQILYYYNLFHSFRLTPKDTPLQSVSGWESVPWDISVFEAMGLQLVFQELTILLLMTIILMISEISGNYLNAIFFGSVVLILPVILYSFGLAPAQYISCYIPYVFYPLLLSEQGGIWLPLIAAGMILLIGLCQYFLLRRYRIGRKRRCYS